MKLNQYGVLYAALLVIIFWILTPSIINWLFIAQLITPTQEKGQLGDMYGFVTSLFSGITIVGLVYTIIQQREDLRIARESLLEQRKEAILNREVLELSRNEMTLSKKAIEQSSVELKNQIRQQKFQRFETTFFNLTDQFLKMHEKFTHAELHKDIQELLAANAEYNETKSKNQYQIIEDKITLRVKNLSKKYYSFISAFRTINGWICDRKKKHKNRQTYFALFFNFLSHEQRVLLLIFIAFQNPFPTSASEYLDQLRVSVNHEKIGGIFEIKIEKLLQSIREKKTKNI